MYLQLYFHKTSVAGEAMLQNIARKLDGWSLPARLDEYVLLDESNIYAHLVSAAKEVSKDESSFKELGRPNKRSDFRS